MLRTYLAQPLYQFDRLREDIAALIASLPVVTLEELMVGMDFED
jgi:hypothetical protein